MRWVTVYWEHGRYWDLTMTCPSEAPVLSTWSAVLVGRNSGTLEGRIYIEDKSCWGPFIYLFFNGGSVGLRSPSLCFLSVMKGAALLYRAPPPPPWRSVSPWPRNDGVGWTRTALETETRQAHGTVSATTCHFLFSRLAQVLVDLCPQWAESSISREELLMSEGETAEFKRPHSPSTPPHLLTLQIIHYKQPGTLGWVFSLCRSIAWSSLSVHKENLNICVLKGYTS